MALSCIHLRQLRDEINKLLLLPNGPLEASQVSVAPPPLHRDLRQRWKAQARSVHHLYACVILVLHEACLGELGGRLEQMVAESIGHWSPPGSESTAAAVSVALDTTAVARDTIEEDNGFIVLESTGADALVGEIESEVELLQSAKTREALKPYLNWVPRRGRHIKDTVVVLEQRGAKLLLLARLHDLRIALGINERWLQLLRREFESLIGSGQGLDAVDTLRLSLKVCPVMRMSPCVCVCVCVYLRLCLRICMRLHDCACLHICGCV